MTYMVAQRYEIYLRAFKSISYISVAFRLVLFQEPQGLLWRFSCKSNVSLTQSILRSLSNVLTV